MLPFEVIARGPFSVTDVGPPPALSQNVRAEVDAHWAASVRERPTLFDDDIFCATRIADGSISGCFLPYRYHLALFERPDLRGRIPLTLFGVVGITMSAEGSVLLARRSSDVMLSGVWELAPAGGINRSAIRDDGGIDVRGLLLAELEEETGIGAGAVASIEAASAAHWPGYGTSEIAFVIRTTFTRAEIEAAFAQRSTTEYDAMRWWSPGDPVDDDIAEPVAYLTAVLDA